MDRAALEELFAPLGRIATRRMFGGQGVFHDGMMIGFLGRDGTLYLKTDGETEALFAAAGGHAFAFRRGEREMVTSYWTPPDAVFDDADALRLWAGRAEAAARRAAAARSPLKRSRRRQATAAT